MKNKKGPLGTPLGDPLKYFREAREARISKASRGLSIMKNLPDPKLPPTGPRDSYTNTTKGELSMNPETDPTGPSNDRFEQRYPGSTFIDTSKYNPNSKQAKVLNTLKILNEFKNRPMKKGGSVKRKKK